MKSPEGATPGLFYSFLGGWLILKADYQLFISVQPFADVVGDYTAKTESKKDENILMATPHLSLPV